MKKLFLILVALSGVACNNKEDDSCNCNSQRYERYVNKNISTQAITYASEWSAVGSESPAGADCDSNGLIKSSGSENTYLLPGGIEYAQREFKYQIKCK